MSVTQQGSPVQASMVDVGTTAASPDYSRPCKLLHHLCSPGRGGLSIDFLSYSSGWDKDPFTLHMPQLSLFLPFLGVSDGPPMGLGLSQGGGAASDSSSSGCSMAGTELDLSGTGSSGMHSVPRPPSPAWLWGLLGDLSKLSLTQDLRAGAHLQSTCVCCHGNTAGVLQLSFGTNQGALWAEEGSIQPRSCSVTKHLSHSLSPAWLWGQIGGQGSTRGGPLWTFPNSLEDHIPL